MAKPHKRLEARKLRSEYGESIKLIAKKLGVSVSSVSLWCRDIELTDQQIKRLSLRATDPYYGKRLNYIISVKNKKDKKIRDLKNKGIDKVGDLNKRELFLVGTALYWSEGFKKDNQVGFANSDPKMIKLFIRWLYECFGYSDKDLIPRLTLNISYKDKSGDIEKYWSEVTRIPLIYFGKTFFQKVKWKKIYENKSEYKGVLRIRVRKSTDFLREIYGYIYGLGNQPEVESPSN